MRRVRVVSGSCQVLQVFRVHMQGVALAVKVEKSTLLPLPPLLLLMPLLSLPLGQHVCCCTRELSIKLMKLSTSPVMA